MPKFEFTDDLDRVVGEAANFLAPIYFENNWTWGRGIPDAGEIAKTLTQLCTTLIDCDYKCVGSGRLCVRRDKMEQGEKLSLYLELGEVEQSGNLCYGISIYD